MKLPILPDAQSLCDQCVALCCRYYAFALDTPKTRGDFEYMRWYMLHQDTIIFVEDGEWYIQVNRPCAALGPDNRCGIYEHRPSICRGYTTKGCDWHGDEYDYEQMFSEPEQLQRFAKEYLARRRKRRTARTRQARRPAAARKRTARRPAARKRVARRAAAKKATPTLRLLKSA